MQITHFQRCPRKADYSIERIFADIRRVLPESINAKVVISRFQSSGLFRRIYNIVEVIFYQGDVNHITGDVHFLALLLKKRKTLLTVHDFASIHRLKGWRRAIVFFFWYWLPLQRVAMVSVISTFTKEEVLRHIKIDPQKIRVIHDPVSSDFHPSLKEFNSKKPVILQIGAAANKNVERVIQSLKGISCHLRVIGKFDKNQLDILKQYGVEFSSVSDLSNEQIIDEYCRGDMLVFVSTYEGFGLPIVEAQAVGRPVVTSNICSMPEVAGDAACLVDPFDISSINEGILKVINDKVYREELVRQGFNNVKRFQPERIAMEYVDIYRELFIN